MKIGFTGTRDGMTDRQKNALQLLLGGLTDVEEFHHGNCLGADAEAARMADSCIRGQIHSHPCNLPFMQAHTGANVTYEVKPPLDRNQDIVNMTDLLIAAPKSHYPSASGGTWFTIRYAGRQGKPVVILEP